MRDGVIVNRYLRGDEERKIIINYTANDIELDGVTVPAQRAVAVR